MRTARAGMAITIKKPLLRKTASLFVKGHIDKTGREGRADRIKGQGIMDEIREGREDAAETNRFKAGLFFAVNKGNHADASKNNLAEEVRERHREENISK